MFPGQRPASPGFEPGGSGPSNVDVGGPFVPRTPALRLPPV